MEPLGDAIPKRGNKQETVAFFTFRGENVFRTNSGAFIDDKENDLGNEVFKFMKAQGLLGNAKAYGGGDARFLTHAEAQSLMKAWKLAGGSESGAKVMPTNIVMYVDRETCDFCLKGLPHLLYFMGIQVLTIYAKNNAKLHCTPSSDPNPKGNCVELRRANS